MHVESDAIMARLVADFGYTEQRAKEAVLKLQASHPSIQEAFEKWWLGQGLDKQLVVQEYTLQKLIEQHGLNPMNAFLTMDWLIREPTKALRGLSRGRDYVLVSSEVKAHYQQRKEPSKSQKGQRKKGEVPDMTDKLFLLGKPCFYVVQSDASAFQDLASRFASMRRESVIRMIRGKKSTDVTRFFDEIAAALQFPYYFGENWPAFEECITDLDWMAGDAYLLLVNDASSLLCDADHADLRTLLRILESVNEQWLTPNAYIPRQRQPTPFHILLQCREDDITIVTQRLVDAGVMFEQT